MKEDGNIGFQRLSVELLRVCVDVFQRCVCSVQLNIVCVRNEYEPIVTLGLTI